MVYDVDDVLVVEVVYCYQESLNNNQTGAFEVDSIAAADSCFDGTYADRVVVVATCVGHWSSLE